MKFEQKNITIIGGGSWGSALASVLSDNGYNVLQWMRKTEDVELLNLEHKNKYFDGFTFKDNVKATDDLDIAFGFSNVILIAIPIKTINVVLASYLTRYKDSIYIMSSKGLFQGESLSQIFYDYYRIANYCILSGPSFAIEVMNKKNTAVVVAAKNYEIASYVQDIFNNNYFKVYTSDDVLGVEYCGAIKNVYAIVSGMMDYEKMGNNTKNAVLTRCLHEIARLIKFIGAKIDTVLGLAGIGDLMLTCSSSESRNYSYGYNFAKDKKPKGTVEGLNTLEVIHDFCVKHELDMPIVNSLYKIINGDSTIEVETDYLMNREKKDESTY